MDPAFAPDVLDDDRLGHARGATGVDVEQWVHDADGVTHCLGLGTGRRLGQGLVQVDGFLELGLGIGSQVGAGLAVESRKLAQIGRAQLRIDFCDS